MDFVRKSIPGKVEKNNPRKSDLLREEETMTLRTASFKMNGDSKKKRPIKAAYLGSLNTEHKYSFPMSKTLPEIDESFTSSIDDEVDGVETVKHRSEVKYLRCLDNAFQPAQFIVPLYLDKLVTSREGIDEENSELRDTESVQTGYDLFASQNNFESRDRTRIDPKVTLKISFRIATFNIPNNIHDISQFNSEDYHDSNEGIIGKIQKDIINRIETQSYDGVNFMDPDMRVKQRIDPNLSIHIKSSFFLPTLRAKAS